MSVNLKNKYKERSPEETISIVQNFFESRGYDFEFILDQQSEAQTWSCSARIKKGGKVLLTTHGKGMTQIYSRASGCAELFERYCNLCNSIRIPLFTNKLIESQKKKTNYSFHPDEKIMTTEEVLQSARAIDYVYAVLLHDKNLTNEFFKIITNNEIVGEPYISLTNPDEKPYYDPRILNRVTGSVGMCAGNTVEEALNQGLSEICEHMAEQQFFMKPQDKYYAIDLNSITNPELQQKIKLIQNEGLILYIFDLSYNFNVPAVMSVIINPESKNTNINFGSFPVFDIAVERIITEIYQGVKTFKNLLNLQVPYRVFDLEQLMDFSNSLCGLPSFNESIFLDKLITVDKPNKDIYISDSNIDNEYINNYFINLFKSLNMSIHYINHSLIPEMAALEIFIPEHNYILSAYLNNANYDFDYIYENFLTLAQFHKFSQEILFNHEATLEEHFQRSISLHNKVGKETHDGALVGALMFGDWLNPLPQNSQQSYIIFNLYGRHDVSRAAAFHNTIFYKNATTMMVLREYINCEQYTADEIKRIFKHIFNTEISDMDILNCNNDEYILLKTYIDPLITYYNSEEYQSIIDAHLKNL